MADPKYANLVGIAYDQPDVYETKDLPEADQNAEIYEEDSESIERLHISATTALTKFKGKALDSKKVDFSDRLSRRPRTGYDARSGDWELAGEGETETPIQKYQRLQCEMKELLDEVAQLKETAKDESSKQGVTVMYRQAEASLKQLTDLRLEEQLGVELVGRLSDPQGAQLKKLASQIEQLEGGGQKQGEGRNAAPKVPVSKRSGPLDHQTTRLAEVDQRLARIEQVIGATPAKMSQLGEGGRPLLETAQCLVSRAALLDATQLEAAETRLSSLITKLDQAAEKTAAITGTADSDKDNKINELYELAKKAERLSHILPHSLERMQALQSLHQQGGEFAKSVSEMESTQVQMMAKLRTNADLLASVEEGLRNSFTTIRADMEALDGRVKALSTKKK